MLMIMCARNIEFTNMKDQEEIFQSNLERCSYRFLQQTAKAMGLPSNVKVCYMTLYSLNKGNKF